MSDKKSNPKNPLNHVLKKYVDDRVDRLEKYLISLMCLRVDALKESTDITKSALEIRLKGMNEFRDSLKDQSLLMYTRAEHNIYAAKIESDIDELKAAMHMARGKAEQSSVNVALAISLISLLLGFIGVLLSII